MRKNIGKILSEIDQLILHGSVAEARLRLAEIHAGRIPRADLVRVANLTRRVYLNAKSVQLLRRVVRPARHSPLVASDHEKAEYAAALCEIGGAREARKLLETVDAHRLPIAYLFRAYTHFREWDWEPAIAGLEALVKHPATAEDIRIWGQLHLGNSLMQARRDYRASEGLLREALARTRPDHFRMAHKNILLLLVQNEYFQKKWTEALRFIEQARATCADDGDPVFTLHLEMWQSLVRLASSRGKDAALRELHGVRARFAEARRWENVRGCDYYEARALEDAELTTRLYYGTPHVSLRARLVQALGDPEAIPPRLDWPLHLWAVDAPPARAASREGAPWLDVSNGKNSLGSAFLKEGQVPQKLLQTLASDLYKPMQVAELHERVYPDQYFDPGSSPDRIHQAIKRLRRWFKAARIPVDVEEDAGAYRLVAAAPCLLRIVRPDAGGTAPPRRAPTVKVERQLQKLGKKFAQAEFTAMEAAAVLGISYRSTIRALNEALEHGAVERRGVGSRTCYRFK